MGKIKNTESLLNHGDRESRKKITELLERMWAKVDAYHLIKELITESMAPSRTAIRSIFFMVVIFWGFYCLP